MNIWMERKSYPKEAGIYKLTCKINGKIYIGKSNGPHSRESIEKMRQAKLGKTRAPFSDETKEKMRLAHQKRRELKDNI